MLCWGVRTVHCHQTSHKSKFFAIERRFLLVVRRRDRSWESLTWWLLSLSNTTFSHFSAIFLILSCRNPHKRTPNVVFLSNPAIQRIWILFLFKNTCFVALAGLFSICSNTKFCRGTCQLVSEIHACAKETRGHIDPRVSHLYISVICASTIDPQTTCGSTKAWLRLWLE